MRVTAVPAKVGAKDDFLTGLLSKQSWGIGRNPGEQGG